MTGSNRAVDRAEAAGQGNIFDLPADVVPQKELGRTVIEDLGEKDSGLAMFSRGTGFADKVDMVLDGTLPESTAIGVARSVPVLKLLRLNRKFKTL